MVTVINLRQSGTIGAHSGSAPALRSAGRAPTAKETVVIVVRAADRKGSERALFVVDAVPT